MDVTLLASKVLGAYLMVSGLFLIFRGKTVPSLLKDFFGHPAIVYLTGVILVFLSSILLLQNNVWDKTWRTIITVFSWLVLLKGLAYIFVPEQLHKIISKTILKTLNLYGLLAFIAGLSLFYIA